MSASTLTKPDTAPVAELPPVTAERCDRCGSGENHQTGVTAAGVGVAQAFIRVILPSGSTLTFCNHHGRENMPSFVERGYEIIDASDQINERPSVSANKD